MRREQLLAIMPAAGAYVDLYLPHLVPAMAEFSINSARRQAAFLANIAQESGQLSAVSENLNYSAQGLANTWPNRYAVRDSNGDIIRPLMPNVLAKSLHRDPVRIANNVYANRMGNGDEATGDGWRHRGAGLKQLTGKDNQHACAKHFGISLERIGDWLRTPEGACRSAAWFWKTNGCNELADRDDFQGVCGVVNVGDCKASERRIIGYPQRVAFHSTARGVLV